MSLPCELWEDILVLHGPLSLLRGVDRHRVAAVRLQRAWRTFRRTRPLLGSLVRVDHADLHLVGRLERFAGFRCVKLQFQERTYRIFLDQPGLAVTPVSVP
jgi:hypothetical protein